MHAPYILSADDLDDFSGIYRKPSILAADDFLGACYRKAMTSKKLWTLLFLHPRPRLKSQPQGATQGVLWGVLWGVGGLILSGGRMIAHA